MTTRARTMLDALEAHAGSATRSEIWTHAGRFFLTNNASAELRAAGVDVECFLVDGDYHYRLLDERHGPGSPLIAGLGAPHPGVHPVSLVEQDGGQFALEVAA